MANDSLLFRRIYFPKETKQLTLHGLGGADTFELHTAETGRPIPLQLYSGPGADQLHLRGKHRHLKLCDTIPDQLASQLEKDDAD